MPGTLTTIKCAWCGKRAKLATSAVNRARRIRAPLYCNRACAGLSRRRHKTKAQRVEEKRLYDAEYRKRNAAMLRAKKAAYFQQTYDPKRARIERKKRAHLHVEYCRQPEYRVWKQKYDRRYRANKFYGPFADAFLLTRDLNHEIHERMTDYEIRLQNQTLNKRLNRRREAQEASGRRHHSGP